MATREERGTGTTMAPPEARSNGATTASQWGRWAALADILFVDLMSFGTLFVADVPDAPRQEIADYLADSANDTRNIIGACMWVVGALAFGREEPRAWQDGIGHAGSLTIRTGG